MARPLTNHLVGQAPCSRTAERLEDTACFAPDQHATEIASA